jgi:hypothetical protein
MIIEVGVYVFKEVMLTRTSKIRKLEFKLGRKPTERHGIDPVKIKMTANRKIC